MAEQTPLDTPKRLRQFRLAPEEAGTRMAWDVDWPLDRLMCQAADEISALRDRCAALEQERDEWKVLAKVGTWHDDCRPNRHQAARELAKSQAVINKLADTISAREQEIAAVRTFTEGRLAFESHRRKGDGMLVDPNAVLLCQDVLARLPALAQPNLEPEQHRCSGCGHRWEGPILGAEYCGDCHRAILDHPLIRFEAAQREPYRDVSLPSTLADARPEEPPQESVGAHCRDCIDPNCPGDKAAGNALARLKAKKSEMRLLSAANKVLVAEVERSHAESKHIADKLQQVGQELFKIRQEKANRAALASGPERPEPPTQEKAK